MKTKILKLKSTLLKSKYGSKMVLFKYYWKCEMDRLNQETQKLRLLFWIQKKGFHVAFYDEELIEDAFSDIFNNTKVVKIVHNNTKRFILGDGTNDYNSIWEKTIDHLSIIDANQKFRNVLLRRSLIEF